MHKSLHLAPFVAAALTALFLAACATQPGSQVDPVFNAVPGGQYACDSGPDNRNAFVQTLTSPVGQAAIGGALGGLLGNQFGHGTGNKISTGVGSAAGVGAGAWNAKRMSNNRYQQCLQRQQSAAY